MKPWEHPTYAISPKTAAALTDPLRTRILTELDLRSVSPSELAEEIGGDLCHVSRCFRQLARRGLAEVVEERPGRRPGAAVEHVYRGISGGSVDGPHLRGLPLTGRPRSSSDALEGHLRPLHEAISTGTFDAEPDRVFSWDLITIDRIAWKSLRERLDEISGLLPAMDIDSPDRKTEPDDARIPTTVGLSLFRLAQPVEMIRKLPPRQYPNGPRPKQENVVVRPEAAKAMSSPLRAQIMTEISDRPMSPSQFVEDSGGDISYVARCFRQLASWGFLEVAEVRKGGRKGGGVERIFRRSQRTYFPTQAWECLPRFLRKEISSAFLTRYDWYVGQAFEAGSFDAPEDRHLSCHRLLVDRLTWGKIRSELDGVLFWLPTLERQSRQRVGQDLDGLIPAGIGLTSFRTPPQG